MLKIISILAGITAILIGIFSATTGIRVLIGSFSPGYITHTPLIVYNITLGFISIYAGYLILKQKRMAVKLSAIITILHSGVLISLVSVFHEVVAQQSINAMIFRAVIWILISLVVFTAESRKNT